MNILFVYPSWRIEKTVNHGIASLSAYVKKDGHETALVYLDSSGFKAIERTIEGFQPRLIAVSTMTNQWPVVRRFTGHIKKKFDIPVIVGGPHITACPDALNDVSSVDGVCAGEGEIPLQQFAAKLQRNEPVDDVPNFSFRKEGKISVNALCPLIEDLDRLPLPDYTLFPREIYLNYPSLSLSRGCPYNCTYCCNEQWRELYKGKGKVVRLKSVHRAFEEIEMVMKQFNPSIINFDDDSFTKSKRWIEEFCGSYKKHFKVSFRCNTRPELLNEEIVRQLKEAGCQLISIGIESGDESIRSEVLHRKMSDETIIRAFAWCRQYGIQTSSFNMVGLPGETPEKFQKTIDLNLKINPDRAQLSVFYPYPGTELGTRCSEKGYLLSRDVPGYFRQGVLELPGFSNKQITRAYRQFYWRIFKRQSIVKALYFYVLKVYLERYPVLWESAKFIKRKLKGILTRQ